MSQPGAQLPRFPPARATISGWRASHWVALTVIAAGLLMVVWSPFVGDRFYDQAVTPLIELLGAPEEREESFHPQDPNAGTELLVLLGGCNLAVGLCMFCVLLVLELLGVAGAPALTGGMGPRGKLALGTAATGLVVFAVGALPGFLLGLLFVDHEYAVRGAVRILDVISQVGGLLMLCAAITLLLGGSGPLLRWTEVVGWGSVRRGWVNRLALALIAGGLVSMVGFLTPFGDVAGAFFTVGVTVLVLGIVPQLLGSGRP